MKGDSFLLKVFDVTILIRSDTLLSPVEYLFQCWPVRNQFEKKTGPPSVIGKS